MHLLSNRKIYFKRLKLWNGLVERIVEIEGL